MAGGGGNGLPWLDPLVRNNFHVNAVTTLKLKPLFNFELQVANNYANISDDIKDKSKTKRLRTKIRYKNIYRLNYKKNNNHD